MTEWQIKNFKKIIWNHYRKNGRYSLPWRKTRDPYKILISEVMLQQTQVSKVLQKYPQFLRAFPNVQTLAKAPLKRILRVWQGMGYNRRAKALKQVAMKILTDFEGEIPKDPVKLRELPGVGEYTANAVCIFAFSMPLPCIETNIRRVYIHHFFPRAKNISDKKLLPLVEKTLDTNNPREWFYALMDYGAVILRHVKNPNRKSKHYVRQTPFKGSNREVRGRILKILLKKNSMRLIELKRQIPHPRIEENIEELVREQFLQKRVDRFSLA